MSIGTLCWPSTCIMDVAKIKECISCQQSRQNTVNEQTRICFPKNTFQLGTLDLHGYIPAISSTLVLDPYILFYSSNEVNKRTIVKDHRIPIKPVRKCQLGYSNAVNDNVKLLLSIPGLSVKCKPV